MSFQANYPSSASSLAWHPARLIQSAFEQGHTGMVITDTQGHIVLANEAFCRLTGCERAEAPGWPIEHFFVSLRIPATLPIESDAPAAWQQEVLCRRHDGESRPLLMTVDALLGDDGTPHHYLRTFVDLTMPEGQHSGPRHWVHVDPMTGLPNWLLLRDRLNHALAQADRAGQSLALLFIDIDRFKAVNDTVGHLEGDRLLGELARRMQGALRSKDTLARLGGDEFVMILEQDGSAEAAQAVAERLQEALEPPFIAENRQLLLTASIGIALFPFDAEDEETLITGARSAMHTARRKGPGRLAFVDHRLTAQLKEKHRLECQFSEAIQLPERHFVVHYQPELDATSGHCVGLEATLFWRQPRRGLRPISEFQDTVTRLRLGVRLDRWVIQQVAADHRRWLAEGSSLGDLPVSVPLCNAHLAHDTFDGRPLDHFLRQQGQPSLEWLTLEIPGLGLGKDLEAASHMLKRLRQLGIGLVVNDLGTSPVDLAWLARLPFRRAKLNITLASSQRDEGRSLAEGLCRLLEALGIEPAMAGIEGEQEAQAIAGLPLARIQGDYYCPALARGELEAWCATRRSAES